MPDLEAEFRCYAELNDFLPQGRKHASFRYRFDGGPSVKDAIEAVGILDARTEVDLVLIDGESVGFDHHLRHGERVAVFPMFESLDISSLARLREIPLRSSKFVLDVHLSKLARLLRMLGFDVLHKGDYDDREIVAVSVAEARIVLTRNRGLLKHKAVTHGYWVRSAQPEDQIAEVLARFDLYSQIAPFHRCMVCNGHIESIDKSQAWDRLPEKTRRYYDEFYTCPDCHKLYWKGSHYRHMQALVRRLGGGRKALTEDA